MAPLHQENGSLYQEGMRDLSINVAKEVASKIPVPKDATAMLDIGGSHGLFSIELCKRHPRLSSTIYGIARSNRSCKCYCKKI